jgi:hypothetical protein
VLEKIGNPVKTVKLVATKKEKKRRDSKKKFRKKTLRLKGIGEQPLEKKEKRYILSVQARL